VKHPSILAGLALAMLGCAGSGGATSGLTGPGGRSPSAAAAGGALPGAAAASPSWWERTKASWGTNPFASSPETKLREDAARRAELQRRTDPLALAQQPGKPTPAVLLSMAQLSEYTGQTDRARQLYAQALAEDDAHLEALLGLARLEDREGRFDEALVLYHRAAAKHPANTAVLNDLALCYSRKGELPRALAVLDRAVQMAPQNPLYRNNIAKVLVKMGLVDDALVHQTAVNSPAAARYNVGYLLLEQQRTAEAESFFRAAAAADPQLGPARYQLAQLELRAAQRLQAASLAAGETAGPGPGSASAEPPVVGAGPPPAPVGSLGTPTEAPVAVQGQRPAVAVYDATAIANPVNERSTARRASEPTLLPPVR